jgi:hypothetical protein
MVSPHGIALCSAAGRAHQCRLSDLWAPRGDVSRSGSSDDKNDDAPLKYLAENLERQLLPVLGGVMMDRQLFLKSPLYKERLYVGNMIG